MADALERVRSALADRYAVDRAVGEGGMATVYLAHDLKHERQVAIKVLKPELAASLGTERFLREIRVAAQLQHPNILSLYDSGAADGMLYYVMPFVEGESLRDRLTREHQLPLDEAVRIAEEAADALHFAHTRGVIHRDIKPENIMLLGGHVLVADFGIARAVSEAGAEKLTQTGMTLGTPHYMSPEQAVGAPIDGRSDLYSLACVLYEMLVGQAPFDGPNALAIMARHAMEDPRSMQIVRKTIPDELEELVFGALAKAPADRFATLAEFSEALSAVDLSAVVHRTTPRTAMTGTSSRVRARRRKRQLIRAAAWTGGIVLAASAGWFLVAKLRSRPVAAAAGADPQSIAVLYFENRSPNDSLTYVADGLTEALIGELSGVTGLRVISANGVAPYRGARVAPDSISRALRVGTLVTGTLGQARDSLRLTVSLVSAASGNVVGTRELRRGRGDVVALQDELTTEVATFLRQRLGSEITLSEAKAGTRNARAWETLQRANEAARDADTLFLQGDSTTADTLFARADSLYAAAEQLDQKWATPSARRGWLDFRQSRLRLSAPPWYTTERIRDGLQHASRALALDPENPDALELRGTLRYWRWLNNLAPDSAAVLFSDAERDLRAAVERRPTQATAWTTLSHLLINKPAHAEAKLAAMRAYDADPYLGSVNTTLWRLFTTSYVTDDATEAQRWCDEGARRFPADSRFAECRLWTYTMDGAQPDLARGWRELDRYVQLSPPSLQPLNRLKGEQRMAIALARAGLGDSARRVAGRARGDAQVDPGRELAELEAIVHAKRGDLDAAFEQLSLFLAANPQRRTELGDAGSWELKELRGDPRMAALAKGTR